MPDLNAGLLQIGNLSDVIRQGRQDSQNQTSGLLNTLGQSAQAINQNMDNNTINDTVSKNFDPNTKQVNNDAVIQQLYNVNPKLAQKYSQQVAANAQAQQVAQAGLMKTQSEAAKNNADAGKTGNESKGLELQNTMKKIQNGAQLLLGVNDQAGFDNALKYAESQGFDVGQFKGQDFNPMVKQQAYTVLMDAKDTLNNQLEQYKAVNKVSNDQFVADTGRMNANTDALKANQDYNVRKEQNQIGRGELGVKQQQVDQDWKKNFITTPEQQLKLSEANINLQDKQIKNQNEAQQQMAKYEYNNSVSKNIIDTTGSILNGIVQRDKNGQVALDSDGNPLIKKDNILGDAVKRKFYLQDPRNNEYKALDATLGTLVGQVTGKSMQDIKSMFGSQGPVTDKDAETFAAVQGLKSKEDFYNLNQNMQVRILDKINKNAANDIEKNNAQAQKVKQQSEMIQGQSLPSGRIPQQNYNVNVGAPLVGYTPDGAFRTSTGKTYDPAYLEQKYGNKKS
jgi:hypothetical protein